eukprot:TRINITY_DN29590_c0_g1_i1.p1 TRINITY_DN29590_c0_g1~~TRINITY_DN29590_c0_g1_i1.p1  ORF type:complete len:457 (-),score=136.86 TRINITY_DN29590_c0_g1_i1:402-1772(-)
MGAKKRLTKQDRKTRKLACAEPAEDAAPVKTSAPVAGADESQGGAAGKKKGKKRKQPTEDATAAGASEVREARPPDGEGGGKKVAGSAAAAAPKAGRLTKYEKKKLRKQKNKEKAEARKEEKKTSPAAQVNGTAAEDAPPPAKKQRKGGQQKQKQQPQAQQKQQPDLSAEAQRVIAALADPSTRGSLSDRLNPGHPCFDKALKQSWPKNFSKKERAAIVQADQQRIKAIASSAAEIQHPFPVMPDDHCETAIEAYRDAAPLLKHLCEVLGKTPETARIYDPYFCAGAVVKHLGELGFQNVYNKCEDFYAVMQEKRIPKHDIVVTNPPYSGDHPERLLRWCRSNGKPFLLLMPNYVCSKDYYEEALGGRSKAKSLLYLCPRKRYNYWTPKGLRDSEKVQSQHAGAGGNRTSPFVSFWYMDLAPALPSKEALRWWNQGASTGNTVLCKLENLPAGVKP